MCKNTVQPDRPQMTTCRMSMACLITKAIQHTQTHTHTHTHREYAILIAFPPQQWLQERASKLCYTYVACIIETRSS